MSWDVMLVKTKCDTGSMDDINDENIIAFDKKEAVSIIQHELVGVIGDDSWMDYECGAYGLSVSFETPHHIMLYVHVGDADESEVLEVIRNLCNHLKCCAFDMSGGEFLFRNVTS